MLPGADLSSLLIVPTCQRAALDLVRTGEDVDTEKDKLLEQVMHEDSQIFGILCCLPHVPSRSSWPGHRLCARYLAIRDTGQTSLILARAYR